MTKSKITKLVGVFVVTFFATISLGGFTHSVNAWGPERQTFTMNNPASYATFNSITDNPTIGDERDFVRIGELHSISDTEPSPTTLNNTAEIIPGHQYLVYIYVHNNASETFDDAAHNYAGVSLETRLSTTFSPIIAPNSPGTVSATVTSSNANPSAVWDEASMTTTYNKVVLEYLTGSAKIYNKWGLNGSIMPNTLFTETGSLIGLNALDGGIPGCERFHVVVAYVLEAKELSGTIDKAVSKDGTDFTKDVKVNPGDEITFKLTIKNSGDVGLTNATIQDTLPEGLTLVPGTTQLMANDSGTWDPLSDNIIASGFNLGRIGTGNTVVITYHATVTGDYDCNGASLTNSATLTYDSEADTGDSSNAFAIVNVRKADCEPVVETCETNPEMDGCNPEETCATNPELPGCTTPTELPNTGPLEITLAVIVILGIAGGGFYLWRTRHVLKTVENEVSGKNAEQPKEEAKTPEQDTTEQNTKQSAKQDQEDTPSQNS